MAIRFLTFIIILFLFMPHSAWADTHTVAACNGTDDDLKVMTALAAADDGDTVSIPAGNCTFTDDVSWDDKEVYVIGAGIGLTNITINDRAFTIDNSTNKPFRLSGFTLIGTTNAATIIQITSEYNTTGASSGWRVDHIRFSYENINTVIKVYGVNYGLVDSCVFDITSFASAYTFDFSSYVDGEWAAHTMGNLAWSLSTTNLGSAEAVYIENNSFNYSTTDSGNQSVVDGINGMRVVFRYNNVYGTMVQTHWARDNQSGPIKYEIYNNIFDGYYNNGESNFAWPAYLKGGTGVIFNNTVANYSNNNFLLADYRSCIAYDEPYSQCDGDCAVDGNVESETGWPCMDQIGRGVATGLIPHAGYGSDQLSIPLYAWNNGESVLAVVGNCDAEVAHIVTTGSEHTGGVVDYVNNGITPKPGYTAHTCPHPLTGLSGTCGTGAGTGYYNTSVSSGGINLGGSGSMHLGPGGAIEFPYP